MNRDIKFRAWHKEKKEMKCLDFLNLSRANFCGEWKVKQPDDLFGIATTVGDLWNIEDVELMQYTGLKDKSGVEIFEGDILKLTSSVKTYISSVLFKDGKFCVKLNDGWYVSIASELFEDTEVLGNIYENPELLEEQNV